MAAERCVPSLYQAWSEGPPLASAETAPANNNATFKEYVKRHFGAMSKSGMATSIAGLTSKQKTAFPRAAGLVDDNGGSAPASPEKHGPEEEARPSRSTTPTGKAGKRKHEAPQEQQAKGKPQQFDLSPSVNVQSDPGGELAAEPATARRKAEGEGDERRTEPEKCNRQGCDKPRSPGFNYCDLECAQADVEDARAQRSPERPEVPEEVALAPEQPPEHENEDEKDDEDQIEHEEPPADVAEALRQQVEDSVGPAVFDWKAEELKTIAATRTVTASSSTAAQAAPAAKAKPKAKAEKPAATSTAAPAAPAKPLGRAESPPKASAAGPRRARAPPMAESPGAGEVPSFSTLAGADVPQPAVTVPAGVSPEVQAIIEVMNQRMKMMEAMQESARCEQAALIEELKERRKEDERRREEQEASERRERQREELRREQEEEQRAQRTSPSSTPGFRWKKTNIPAEPDPAANAWKHPLWPGDEQDQHHEGDQPGQGHHHAEGQRGTRAKAGSAAAAGAPGDGGHPGRGHGDDSGEDEEDQQQEREQQRRRRGDHPVGAGGGGGDDGPNGGGHEPSDDGSEESNSSGRQRSGRQDEKRSTESKIKPLKDKQLVPPPAYDSAAGTGAYRLWREKFRALIEAQGDGIDWEEVLDEVEAIRHKIISEENGELQKIVRKFKWNKTELKIVQSNLYHMLQQYTKGTTQERVTTATRRNALDQYRMLYFEGMAVSDHALFLAKARVWRVPEVKQASDFAVAVDTWEADRDFLQRHAKYEMALSDQHFVLLHICPADLRKEILKDYSTTIYTTYMSLKQKIVDLIRRDQDLNVNPRRLNEVGKKKKGKEQEEQPDWDEEPEAWDPSAWDPSAAWGYEPWTCPPCEPQAQDGWTFVGALKGSGKGKDPKGKGKGKKGKKGGTKGVFSGTCWICGQAGHSQRFCPYAAGKGKGKGELAAAAGQNPGKGGGGPAWAQKGGGQPPRVNALGDDPATWRIGADGQVTDQAMQQQQWLQQQAPPGGSGSLGAMQQPLQQSPPQPSPQQWAPSLQSPGQQQAATPQIRFPGLGSVSLARGARGLNCVSKVAEGPKISGAKFFGGLDDLDEYPTPSVVSEAASQSSTEHEVRIPRKKLSKIRRGKAKTKSIAQVDELFREVDEADEAPARVEMTLDVFGNWVPRRFLAPEDALQTIAPTTASLIDWAEGELQTWTTWEARQRGRPMSDTEERLELMKVCGGLDRALGLDCIGESTTREARVTPGGEAQPTCHRPLVAESHCEVLPAAQVAPMARWRGERVARRENEGSKVTQTRVSAGSKDTAGRAAHSEFEDRLPPQVEHPKPAWVAEERVPHAECEVRPLRSVEHPRAEAGLADLSPGSIVCQPELPAPAPPPPRLVGPARSSERRGRLRLSRNFGPMCSDPSCSEVSCRYPNCHINQSTPAEDTAHAGSDTELPPVTDDGRQGEHEVQDQQCSRRSPQPKPQSVAERWKSMPSGMRIATRQAQRHLEAETGMTRAETERMQPHEVQEMSRKLREEGEERRIMELEEKLEERCRELELECRCETCHGPSSDPPVAGSVTRQGPPGALVDEHQAINDDEAPNSEKANVETFKEWMSENPGRIAEMLQQNEARGRKSEPDGWLPAEARAFLRSLGCVNLATMSGAVTINNVKTVKAGWRKMKVTVDSGAAESVIPVDENPNYPKEPHSFDIWYQTASGEAIKNEGQQRLPIMTPNGRMKGMTFQACDVTKPLASVKRMLDAGHAVIFSPEQFGGSFILNLTTGEEEPLVEEDGNFHMEVWVPPPDAIAEGFGRHP